jgi:SAM-dependent methyltransferase/uncharacterized protein (DUF2062 family)
MGDDARSMTTATGGPVARVRAQLRAVLASHLAPRQLFFAMFVGAIVGASPLYGFHLAICVVLGWLLRLNTPAMYAAANISIPPLIPFVGFASVQLGERVAHDRWLPLGKAEFRALAEGPGGVKALMARFFGDWLVGGVFVGAAIGLLLGAAIYVVADRRRRRDPEAARMDDAEREDEARIGRAIAEASRRYRVAPSRMRRYAYFKYRMDPSYRRIARLVPPGTLTVDVGTGLGMLPLVLALLPGERAAIGIDWDGDKLAAGQRAADGIARIELRAGDARSDDLPPCDVVTIVDVLHYHDEGVQRALLERAARALRPGGLLLVRDGDAASERTGAAFTRWLEAVAVRLGWNRGSGRNTFRGAGAIAADLEALGLAVTVEPLAGRLHPGNVLLVARKADGTGSTAAASKPE